jgi:REP element-mobilizing transposase RayT
MEVLRFWVVEMTLYRKKYRIGSIRLKDWDYGSPGYYFVTICTEGRKCFFGKVIEDEMKLSSLGRIASRYWHEIPSHFPYVKLDEYIVMPNHIHGIIIIGDHKIVETQNFVSLPERKGNRFGPQSKNLASIIRGYKIGVKKWSRINNIPFSWQRNYYEHIIRSENELNEIREYILNNPIKWSEDEGNPDNVKK